MLKRRRDGGADKAPSTPAQGPEQRHKTPRRKRKNKGARLSKAERQARQKQRAESAAALSGGTGGATVDSSASAQQVMIDLFACTRQSECFDRAAPIVAAFPSQLCLPFVLALRRCKGTGTFAAAATAGSPGTVAPAVSPAHSLSPAGGASLSSPPSTPPSVAVAVAPTSLWNRASLRALAAGAATAGGD